MKFVFALALVAICVVLLHARPNVQKRDTQRLLKRSNGNGGQSNSANGADARESKSAEMRGEGKHLKKRSNANDESSNSAEGVASSESKGERAEENGEKDHSKEQSSGNGKSSNSAKGVKDRKKRDTEEEGVNPWPDTNIKYKFDVDASGNNYGDQQKCRDGECVDLSVIVLNAMAEWNEKAGLDIEYDQGCTDCITIKNGDGCWSWIGYQDPSGSRENEIILQNDMCFTHGVALHEVGHSIGLEHEAKQWIRDDKITINYANIEDGMEDQFTLDKSTHTLTGTYDFCSIMQYGITAFTSNGLPTIDVNDEEDVDYKPCMGSQINLSLEDGKGVASLYGELDGSYQDCQYSGYRLKDASACVCSNLFEGDNCQNVKEHGDQCTGDNLVELTSVNDDPVIIKTPNYPGSNYPTDVTCTWVVTGPKNNKMCVGFPTGWSLEEAATSDVQIAGETVTHRVCHFDWFEIMINPKFTLKTQRHCDTTSTGFYHAYKQTSGEDFSFAAIKFKSDDFQTGGGFQAFVKLMATSASEDDCRQAIEDYYNDMGEEVSMDSYDDYIYDLNYDLGSYGYENGGYYGYDYYYYYDYYK